MQRYYFSVDLELVMHHAIETELFARELQTVARALTAAGVTELNDKFADVLRRGAIVQSKALPQERNEPEILSLPRLVLTPHRRSFGRFRQLIDAINRAECV